jgi:hypothetical protein
LLSLFIEIDIILGGNFVHHQGKDLSDHSFGLLSKNTVLIA